MAFTPSTYQQAVMDWADDIQKRDIKENLLIEAVAGSGKSTTLLELVSRLAGRVLVVAFNKHIVEEFVRMLGVRGTKNVDVKTNHSLGNSAIYHSLGRVQLDDKKYFWMAKDGMTERDWDDKTLRSAVLKLTDLARLTLTDVKDKGAMEELAFRYDLDANGSIDKALELVPLLINEGLRNLKTIDFVDQLWFPNALELPVPHYDWVLTDECQDLCRAQQELVLSAAKNGRIVMVGDRRQSIMGFAGADTNSIPRLIKATNAKTLPLSICYRCPKSHIDLVKSIVPQIEARPDAPEGEIRRASFDEAIMAMSDRDMVVCRVNAPLAKICLALIKNGTKSIIRGRDIGRSLGNLLDKHAKGADFNSQLVALDEYMRKECDKLEKRGKDVQAESLRDRVETIHALTDGLDSMEALKARIDAIFTDDKIGVVCSSIHRAKGLQAERVFVYNPALMDAFIGRAKSEEAKLQETNLKYVSFTRAKSSLWLVEESPEDRKAREAAAARRALRLENV